MKKYRVHIVFAEARACDSRLADRRLATMFPPRGKVRSHPIVSTAICGGQLKGKRKRTKGKGQIADAPNALKNRRLAIGVLSSLLFLLSFSFCPSSSAHQASEIGHS
jgi:hypothetical protein